MVWNGQFCFQYSLKFVKFLFCHTDQFLMNSLLQWLCFAYNVCKLHQLLKYDLIFQIELLLFSKKSKNANEKILASKLTSKYELQIFCNASIICINRDIAISFLITFHLYVFDTTANNFWITNDWVSTTCSCILLIYEI